MGHGRLTGIMVVLLASAFRPSPASACTCVVGAETCPMVAEAEGVFEATVVSIERRGRPSPHPNVMFQQRLVHLADVRAWRGRSADVVLTGGGGGDCGYDFKVGTRYVIVAYRSPEDGLLSTSICTMTRPLVQASGVRAYIDSLSAPSQGGRVWGRVSTSGPRIVASRQGSNESSRQPVAAARVSVDGPIHLSETVDADGLFTFAALPPGEYTVSVALPPNRRDLRPGNSYTVTLDRAYACAELDFWGWREP